MYRSEIRDSQKSELLEKVKKQKYGEYLVGMQIHKIRGFSDKDINFEFPVTALIGSNGSGKSSILGAAACAYKSIKPSLFFPKSSIGDTSMAEWGASYNLINRKQKPDGTIKRNSNFKRSRWNRDNVLERHVLFFGIQRTVPAGEKTIFKKLTSSTYKHNEALQTLEARIASEVNKVLGKDVSNFKLTHCSGNIFLVGENEGTHYSEFHFGAGESSIIKMIEEIEKAPNNSLVLIEEIENGLHPIATTRMVEYLINVASRKNIQAIFTTHSDYALLPLPNEAIWSCVGGELRQGKLSVEALRAISGKVDKELVIYVEDDFAKKWVESILRGEIEQYFDQIEIHAVGGDGNALGIHEKNLRDPAFTKKSMCILDGDSLQRSDGDFVKRLPGKQPEYEVFSTIYNNLNTLISKLTVSCHLRNEQQDYFKQILTEINSTNRDPHILFDKIGEQIGFIPTEVIRNAFFTYWIEYNKDFCNELVKSVKEQISNK
jgi:hypothetical protein